MLNRSPYRKEKGLVLHCPLTHADARDMTGNGYNGTLVDNAAVTSGYVELDGSGDIVDFDNILNDVFAGIGKAFTVACWCRFDTTGTRMGIAAKYADAGAGENNRQWFWERRDTNYMRFIVYGALNNGSSNTQYNASTIFSAANWYHCVATFDQSLAEDNRVKMWVDGDAETVTPTSGSVTVTSIQSGTAHLAIGAVVDSTGTPFNLDYDGRVGDFRIYNYAMTDAEVESLYNDTRQGYA